MFIWSFKNNGFSDRSILCFPCTRPFVNVLPHTRIEHRACYHFRIRNPQKMQGIYIVSEMSTIPLSERTRNVYVSFSFQQFQCISLFCYILECVSARNNNGFGRVKIQLAVFVVFFAKFVSLMMVLRYFFVYLQGSFYIVFECFYFFVVKFVSLMMVLRYLCVYLQGSFIFCFECLLISHSNYVKLIN